MIKIKTITIIIISILLFSCYPKKRELYNKYENQINWDNVCLAENAKNINTLYKNNLKYIFKLNLMSENEFNLLWDNYCDCTFNASELIYDLNANMQEIDGNLFISESQKNCYIDQVAYKLFDSYYQNEIRGTIEYASMSDSEFQGLVHCTFYSKISNVSAEPCQCEPEIIEKIQYIERDVIVEKEVVVEKPPEGATIDQKIQMGFGFIKLLEVISNF